MADPRIEAKRRAAEEMLEWASKASGRSLKEKYRPKPPPPAAPEAPPAEEPIDFDLLTGIVGE